LGRGCTGTVIRTYGDSIRDCSTAQTCCVIHCNIGRTGDYWRLVIINRHSETTGTGHTTGIGHPEGIRGCPDRESGSAGQSCSLDRDYTGAVISSGGRRVTHHGSAHSGCIIYGYICRAGNRRCLVINYGNRETTGTGFACCIGHPEGIGGCTYRERSATRRSCCLGCGCPGTVIGSCGRRVTHDSSAYSGCIIHSNI